MIQSGLSTSPKLLKLDTTELQALTAFMSAMPGINLKARNSAMKSVGYGLKAHAKKLTNNPNGLPSWPQITNLAKMTKVVKALDKPRPFEWFSRRASDTFQAFNLSGNTAPNPYGGKRQTIILNTWGSLPNLLVYNLDEENSTLFFGFQAGIFGRRVKWVNAPTGANGQWGTNNQVGAVTKMTVDNFISDKIVNVCKQMTEGYSYVLRSRDEQRYYAAIGFPMKLGTLIVTPSRPLVGPAFYDFKDQIVSLFQDKFWASMRRNTYPQSAKILNDWFGQTDGGARAMK